MPKFKCLECDDEFLFERSLEHHYNRRSVLIEFKCLSNGEKPGSDSAKLMRFFNKCALLKYWRGIKNDNREVKYCDTVVKILPMKYMTAKKPDYENDPDYQRLNYLNP